MINVSAIEKNTAHAEDRLTIDPVTGLRNEYLFRLRLPEEFHQARERETNGTLLAIKLDNIVDINSRHGRTGGDEALRALSNLLKNIQAAPENSAHLLFKLSGPVFGYFIPACDADAAYAIAREILKRVFMAELFIERITTSIGAVNLYEYFMSEEDLRVISSLIEQTALRRILIAEKNGGNTICHTSEIMDSQADTRPRILIVDPDQSVLDLMTRSLRLINFEVETCLNGEAAFAVIQAKPPSVIICEAMTPRLNGFMLRDRLRANALLGAIPFILVSHKKTEDYVRKAVDLDIRFYFRKPFSVTEITGLITNLLRGGIP